MFIQVNTDNQIEGNRDILDNVESTIRERLSRFDQKLTSAEVHLKDINSDKGGVDKRCLIELRPNNMKPISVEAQGTTVALAVRDATAKAVHALDHVYGKLAARRNAVPAQTEGS